MPSPRRAPTLSQSKLFTVLDNVPDDDLRAFSRFWNRACAVLTVGGLVAVLVVWLSG